MANKTFITVDNTDPRYETLKRGFNLRWPEIDAQSAAAVYVCRTEDEVRDALQAVVDKKDPKKCRPTVRSGGHCYEDFVSNNPGGVIIDIGLMSGIVVGEPNKPKYKLLAGGQNWDTAVELYKREGKCLPGGSCYSVGAGGHISGGGYGLLSRLHGLTVDWVAAVDILVVNENNFVNKYHLDLDRESDTDRQSLLKACRGAGGGNFGIITAYYFHDLPIAPKKVLFGTYQIGWDQFIDKHGSSDRKKWTARPSFLAFLNRYAQFYKNSDKKKETYGLFSMLKLTPHQTGKLSLTVQYCDKNGTVADKDPFNEFLKEIKGSNSEHPVEVVALDSHMGFTEIPMVTAVPDTTVTLGGGVAEMDWLNATQTVNSSGPNRRGKYKSSYMKEVFTQEEADAFFKFLVQDERAQKPSFSDTRIAIDSYGGVINHGSDENIIYKTHGNKTSIPQRSSILKLQYQTYWNDKAEDNIHINWIRELYYAVHEKYGRNGTPYPMDKGRYEGCYINYPDIDMLDGKVPESPDYNWLQLYYPGIHDELVKTKAKFDPNDWFRHRMSIPRSK